MTYSWKNLWLAAAMLLAVAPMGRLSAQDVKPAGVISLAPLVKQLDDIGYLTETVGQKPAGDQARLMAGIMLDGIDVKRPLGAYVVPGAGDVKVVAFIPVTKLSAVIDKIKGFAGEPGDAGDGVLEFSAGGMPIFVKEFNTWAFVSNSKENLEELPDDPAATLGTLPKDYNLAIRVNVNDIPEELRGMAVSWLEESMARGLEESPAENPEDRELQEKSAKLGAKQIARLINEINTLTYAWNVDTKTKMTHVDVTITAVDQTATARQFAMIKDGPSAYSGFLLPGAAVTANGVTPIAPEEVEQYTSLLAMYRTRALKEIENDEDLDEDDGKLAKEAVGGIFDMLGATVKQGKMDYGAALVLGDAKLSFAAGLGVADGKKMEAALAKVKQIAEDDEDFPEIKLNSGKIGDITLHSITVPVDNADAAKLFGEELEVLIGTSAKSLYVAFGEDAQGLLKKAIDASAAGATKTVAPSQLNVHLKPIMKFAASMESSNPIVEQLADSMENSTASDEIKFFSSAIPKGVRGRLQISEGVLKLIGEATKAFQPPMP